MASEKSIETLIGLFIIEEAVYYLFNMGLLHFPDKVIKTERY